MENVNFIFKLKNIFKIKKYWPNLGWFSVRERRDYLMSVLIYRCLTNNAPVYFCDHFIANSDVNVYDTRSNVNGNLYVRNVTMRLLNSRCFIWVL